MNNRKAEYTGKKIVLTKRTPIILISLINIETRVIIINCTSKLPLRILVYKWKITWKINKDRKRRETHRRIPRLCRPHLHVGHSENYVILRNCLHLCNLSEFYTTWMKLNQRAIYSAITIMKNQIKLNKLINVVIV